MCFQICDNDSAIGILENKNIFLNLICLIYNDCSAQETGKRL